MVMDCSEIPAPTRTRPESNQAFIEINTIGVEILLDGRFDD